MMIGAERSEGRASLWRVRLADLRGRGVYAGAPDKHRCIFIHIPKTAGSSVAESLFGSPSRHVKYTDYLRASPRKFRTYFKFAFVRNPWDRLVSTYFFLQSGGMNELDRQWSEKHMRPYRDFNDFVRRGLGRPEILSWVHFVPQSEFILADDGAIMVDFVGRFEHLRRDFLVIADKLGLGTTLPHRNAGKHEQFGSLYTTETAEIVAKVYARDAEAFGYRAPVDRSVGT